MTPNKFIPPREDEIDYNPEIDRMIEEEMERGFIEESEGLGAEDLDDPDDLKEVI